MAAGPARAADAPGEVGWVRVRYGAVLRQGGQQDQGPGLSYEGTTPNDLGLEGWWGGGAWGVSGSAQREGFGLYDSDRLVATGSLWRVHLGPAARLTVRRVRLEGMFAFQWAQLPGFASSAQPEAFEAGQRQGVLLAGRASVALGPLTLEVRGQSPLVLAAQGPGGRFGSSSGLGLGASVRVPLAVVDKLEYSVAADAERVFDALSWAADPQRPDELSTSRQQVTRLGLALQLRWLDAAPGPAPPRWGGLGLRVVDASSGAALGAAQVELEVSGARRPLQAGPGGAFEAEELEPGELFAHASAPGYLPGRASAKVVAGQRATLEVRLALEPPKVGSLAITLTDKETGAPIAGAKVMVRGASYTSGDQGEVPLPELPPGPVQIEVTADEYHPLQEAASVAAGKKSPVALALLKAVKREPATLSGRVRSTAGGKPIAAHLELPQAKIQAQADAMGLFSFKVQGGVYTVHISAPGYRRQSKSVTVKDGDQAIFNVDLHPK